MTTSNTTPDHPVWEDVPTEDLPLGLYKHHPYTVGEARTKANALIDSFYESVMTALGALGSAVHKDPNLEKYATLNTLADGCRYTRRSQDPYGVLGLLDRLPEEMRYLRLNLVQACYLYAEANRAENAQTMPDLRDNNPPARPPF